MGNRMQANPSSWKIAHNGWTPTLSSVTTTIIHQDYPNNGPRPLALALTVSRLPWHIYPAHVRAQPLKSQAIPRNWSRLQPQLYRGVSSSIKSSRTLLNVRWNISIYWLSFDQYHNRNDRYQVQGTNTTTPELKNALIQKMTILLGFRWRGTNESTGSLIGFVFIRRFVEAIVFFRSVGSSGSVADLSGVFNS